MSHLVTRVLEGAAVLAMGNLSLSSLKSQVSKPYFPVVVFALATANTFAVFLSGLVTTLFVSTCVAVGKKRFAFVALCNALGATCFLATYLGFAALIAGVLWSADIFVKVRDGWRRARVAVV